MSHYWVPWTTSVHLAEGFRRLGHEVWEGPPANQPIGYDFYLRVDDGGAPTKYEARNGPNACYAIDTVAGDGRAVTLAEPYTMVFEANLNWLGVHTKPAFWLPLACPDTQVIEEWRAEGRDLDAGLYGAEYPERTALFDQLQAMGLKAEIRRGDGSDLANFYRRVKVCPNVVLSQAMNMRTFEAPGGGAALVQEHFPDQAVSGLEQLFVGGPEYLRATYDEMAEITRDLVTGGRWESIGYNAWQRVKTKHLYSYRCSTVLDKLEEYQS